MDRLSITLIIIVIGWCINTIECEQELHSGQHDLPISNDAAKVQSRAFALNHNSCLLREFSQGMSYSEALDLAVSGTINKDILQVMRDEVQRAAITGPDSYRVRVMVNLGVALLQLGNGSPDQVDYTAYYRESEDVLVAALKLNPSDANAQSNLESVRTSLRIRSPNTGTQQSQSDNTTTGHNPSKRTTLLTYEQALEQVRAGQVGFSAIDAMRAEHDRLAASGPPNDLAMVKMNLGTVLFNLADNMETNQIDVAGCAALYKESEALLKASLALDPGSALTATKVKLARANRKARDRFTLFNPHATPLGAPSCDHLVLRRLNMQKLAATLFTCDLRTDRGLLWVHESADIEVGEALDDVRSITT
jgi:hypothetical protein